MLISPTYPFELHYSGPHSSDWALHARDVAAGGPDPLLQLNPDYIDIKRLIGKGSLEWVVALATCHWYHCVEDLGKKAAEKLAVKERKQRALIHFNEAWDIMVKAGWLRGRIPTVTLVGDGEE